VCVPGWVLLPPEWPRASASRPVVAQVSRRLQEWRRGWEQEWDAAFGQAQDADVGCSWVQKELRWIASTL
jgi:hypothetical protein